MAAPKGHKHYGGGPTKGQKYKDRELPAGVRYVSAILKDMGLNTFEEAAKIASAGLPCDRCKGRKFLDVDLPAGKNSKGVAVVKTKHITCDICKGTGQEYIPIRLRAAVLMHLNEFQQPKLASVHHDGSLQRVNGETLQECLTKYQQITED